jgi:hypothetical protein
LSSASLPQCFTPSAMIQLKHFLPAHRQPSGPRLSSFDDGAEPGGDADVDLLLGTPWSRQNKTRQRRVLLGRGLGPFLVDVVQCLGPVSARDPVVPGRGRTRAYRPGTLAGSWHAEPEILVGASGVGDGRITFLYWGWLLRGWEGPLSLSGCGTSLATRGARQSRETTERHIAPTGCMGLPERRCQPMARTS